MPVYESPHSDLERLTFLQLPALRILQPANTYVSQPTLDAITAFLPKFEAAVGTLSEKLGARAKETRERAAAIERVITYTCDFWEVLKRRAHRLEQPAEVLRFYGLPLDGAVPNPNTQEEWLALAAQVVKGDADAVAAGYPAMVNLSAVELQAVLDTAQSEAGDDFVWQTVNSGSGSNNGRKGLMIQKRIKSIMIPPGGMIFE